MTSLFTLDGIVLISFRFLIGFVTAVLLMGRAYKVAFERFGEEQRKLYLKRLGKIKNAYINKLSEYNIKPNQRTDFDKI